VNPKVSIARANAALAPYKEEDPAASTTQHITDALADLMLLASKHSIPTDLVVDTAKGYFEEENAIERLTIFRPNPELVVRTTYQIVEVLNQSTDWSGDELDVIVSLLRGAGFHINGNRRCVVTYQ
jgi:hypothetical protein